MISYDPSRVPADKDMAGKCSAFQVPAFKVRWNVPLVPLVPPLYDRRVMKIADMRPVTIVAVGAVLIAIAVAWGQWRTAQRLSARPPLTEDVKRRRAELAEELRPVTLSNCEFVRVGSRNDGGYAMCGNLLSGIETAYSYGIGGNDDWGCQISAAHKVPVHQYDCFNPTRLPCTGGDFRLNAECVGARDETLEGRKFDTMANQIARNGDTGKKMVVKMDIEGSEWQTILAAPDAMFESIVQMPMELHGTDDPEVLDGLRKLKQHFYLVSVHFNNWRCSDEFAPFPNYAYQVLLVNKKVGMPGDPPPGTPTLDSVLAPDNPRGPECQTTIGR